MNRRPGRAARHGTIDGLVVTGVIELALGALTGWPMAVAVSRPEDLPGPESAGDPNGLAAQARPRKRPRTRSRRPQPMRGVARSR